MTQKLLERARVAAGLTQHSLAERAGTSRPTLSAYEHGRKSPTLETTERLLEAAGFVLDIKPRIRWSKVVGARGQVHHVPSHLFSIPLGKAFASFEAPFHLDWSTKDRQVNLSDAQQRGRWYEVVLREGRRSDIERYIDGTLLVSMWSELVLPRAVREAWQKVVDESVTSDV